VGGIEVVSGDDEIFRVSIKGLGPRGVTPRLYDKIKRKLNQFAVYRTYDYEEARRSQVFLEPIKLPKDIREALIGT
tara:strand:- start:20 stop:247 length:228 start_codon:yes stop_codon:yes gene_type:complete